MGLLNKNICPKCGTEYSAFRSGCPGCGARMQSASLRAGARSDTVRRGSRAQQQHEKDSQWQIIFGFCLLTAVMVAVIVLIVTTVNGNYEMYVKPTSSEALVESPTPSPTPTPTPPPTPTVESVDITYGGSRAEDFTLYVGDLPIQLNATVFPIEITDGVEWSSSDPSIITVSDTGLVTAVSPGVASVIARCHGAASQCTVRVPR